LFPVFDDINDINKNDGVAELYIKATAYAAFFISGAEK